MKVLIAEDDQFIRTALIGHVSRWGFDCVSTGDGNDAWDILRGEEAPHMALLDRNMPGMDGAEICRKFRAKPVRKPLYIIILTAMKNTEDIISGIQAGADDYVTKPFEPEELHVRLNGGRRIVDLQIHLSKRVGQLEEALNHVKQLQGLLPICTGCKRIRDHENYWQQVDRYITSHADVEFTHCLCPECAQKLTQAPQA